MIYNVPLINGKVIEDCNAEDDAFHIYLSFTCGFSKHDTIDTAVS